MRLTFILITLLLVSYLANGQDNYYWYQSEKVYLQQDRSISYLNVKNLTLAERNDFIQQTRLKAPMASIANMSANEVVIESNEFIEIKPSIKGKIYQSFLYKIAKSKPILILPTIVIRLAANKRIDEILATYKDRLKVKFEKGYDTYILEFNAATSDEVLKMANQLKENNKDVVWCEPELYGGYSPNVSDPLYPEQYYLKNTGQFGGNYGIDISMELAWYYFPKGHPSLRVAVIDDGVENHEDLATVLPGFTAGSTIGTGVPQNGPKSHGTACAGIIAAQHNTLGIAGIAPNVQIIPVNIFPQTPIAGVNPSGAATNAEIATAIDWAWNQGQADVLSCSWGGGAPSSDIADAIARARALGRNSCGTAKGSVVVFSSGNANQSYSGVEYPANLSGVITVGAIDNKGVIYNYSSRGNEMDLVAPSGNVNFLGDVRTLDRMGAQGFETGNYTNRFGGTSAACPQVSGVAALMLSVNPNLTESQITNMLRSSAIDMGPSGFDNTYGYGRLNAYYALITASASTIYGPSIICNSEIYSLPNVPSGATINWSVTGSIAISGSNTGTSVTVVKTGNGKGSIEAVITNSCSPTTSYTFTKNDIIVGSPLPADDGVWISDNGTQPLDQTAYFTQSQTIYISLFNKAYNSYTWSDFYYHGNVVWYHQAGSDGLVIQFLNPQYGDYVGLDLEASNSCGVNNSPLFFYYEGGPYYFYKAFPNPTNRIVAISPVANKTDQSKLPQKIVEKIPKLPSILKLEVIDKMGKSMFKNVVNNKNTSVEIDVSKFKPDVYTVLLYLDNGKTETHKIIRTE